MELLYRGFDGLDVSFQGQITSDFWRALESAKERAQSTHSDAYLEWGGVPMMVKESGARGGYAYTATTGMFGATWFFKRPNANDPWGIRVSCSSFQLALNGLGKTRSQLIETLASFGITVRAGSESIGRVDYALDYLAPEFQLVPEQFVMHSNASRADHIEGLDMQVAGKSGRTTSVTVGKMPGRQIIVYDKRAEIIAKHKPGWWVIWDENRASRNQPPLERADPDQSRVWRVELRAGKRHLKDQWDIRTWHDLNCKLGDLFLAALAAVRYVKAGQDSNRSRWQDHQLWVSLTAAVGQDLVEFRSDTALEKAKVIQRVAQDELLRRQLSGLLVSRAALWEIPLAQLPEFAKRFYDEFCEDVATAEFALSKRLDRALKRYSVKI